ncbi:MAG: PH domain-containing protein [Phycisphaerales bacterium]
MRSTDSQTAPATAQAPSMGAAHSATAAAAPGLRLAAFSPRGVLGAAMPDGETVILAVKPSIWFVLLSRLGWLVAIVSVGVAWKLLSDFSSVTLPRSTIFSVTAAALAAVLGWRALDWQLRVYVLTDRRILRVSGVLRQTAIEVPLSRVQSVVLYKSIRERVVGIGSLGVSSAGSDGVEVGWYMVCDPEETLETVRQAIERYGRGGHGGTGDGGAAGGAGATGDGSGANP